jgi:predicted RNase H-like nuclease (RuvC/YqgF family)
MKLDTNECVIDGVLHYRNTPTSKWIPYTLEAFTESIDNMSIEIKELKRKIRKLKRKNKKLKTRA